jgi:serine/threonine protein kinase
MSGSSDDRNPVEILAEDFLARQRRGEHPALSEYVARHPELAAEIRELFPVLLDIEDARLEAAEPTGPAIGSWGLAPTKLGDYRILREIGRGGMGIVYEAEQESLGRRVALKVLAGASLTAQQVRRFEREARSAARLHHTNIVPVFGVGQEGGTQYYVMQYIPGQPLNEVLKEVRRLRREERPAGAAAGGRAGRRGDGPSAAEVARSLCSGADPGPASEPGGPDRARPAGSAGLTDSNAAVATTVSDPAIPPEALAPGAPPLPEEPASPSSSGSNVLSSSTDLSGSGRRYARAVARIGVQLADALDYAAEQGVIHRDIKPSNILLDRHGAAWVTDFGLAKVAGQEDLTHTGDLIGTLRYMAPERFRGQADGRGDVYALGLTLYELLALRPAFDEADRARLIRQVSEQDPPRLTRLDTTIPGDLATVVHKAMAREAAERYATAGALAADLTRFLEDRPIVARRTSATERAWRWCRRNKAVALLGSSVAVLLVVVAALGVYLAIRATDAARAARFAASQIREQRDRALAARAEAQTERDAALAQKQRADQQAAIARAVNTFLQDDLLAEASPEKNPRDRKVTVEELLNRAAAKVPGKFGSQPEVEAAIRQTIGETYRALGLYAEARSHLERTLALRRDALGPEHPGTLMALKDLARMNLYEGRFDQAEPLYQQALPALRRVLGPEDWSTLAVLNDLAALAYFRGQYGPAEALFQQALDGRRRTLGPDHRDTLETMNNLAMLYSMQGRYDQAEPLTVQVLEGMRRVRGPAHPDTLTLMNNLGMCYVDLGRYDRAEALFQQALDGRRRTLGPDHPQTLQSLHTLAMIHRAQGRLDRAEPLARQALEGMRRVLGREHPETLNATNHLARVYQDQGRYDRVEELLTPVLEIQRRKLGEAHPRFLHALSTLGRNHLLQRRYTEAEPLLRRCLTALDRKRPDDRMRSHIQSLLGGSLLGQGRYAEAEPLVLAGYEGLKAGQAKAPADEVPRIAEAGARIVALYDAWGRKDRAAEWRKRLAPTAGSRPNP